MEHFGPVGFPPERTANAALGLLVMLVGTDQLDTARWETAYDAFITAQRGLSTQAKGVLVADYRGSHPPARVQMVEHFQGIVDRYGARRIQEMTPLILQSIRRYVSS